MPKRFSDSELWNRDWFLNLEGRHQLFCLYLRDQCDHAGVWNPSFKRFEQSTGFRINPSDYISACNKDGAIRIIILENGKWWITGFIEDQYKTKELTPSNYAYRGVINSLDFNQVPYESIGYKVGDRKPLEGAKDKDKDKDKDIKKREYEGETKKQIEHHWKTPTFQLAWNTWKEYKKDQYRFTYKSPKSEQLALDQLFRDYAAEELAIAAIENSMAQGYRGIFASNNKTAQKDKPEWNGVYGELVR
jgi:hypothetical protein